MKKLIAIIISYALCITLCVGCSDNINTGASLDSNSNGMTFQEECDAIIAAVVLEFYGCEVADIPEEDKLEVTERTFTEEYGIIKNYIGLNYWYIDQVPSDERAINKNGSIKEDGYFIDGFMIGIYKFFDKDNYQTGLKTLVDNNNRIVKDTIIESYPLLIIISTNSDNYSFAIWDTILSSEIIRQYL